MLIRPDGRIVYVNEATVRGMGFSRRYILNHKIIDFFKDKISVTAWRQNHFAELKRKRTPLSFVIERLVSGGRTQTIGITAVYMRFKDQEYVLSAARDITAPLGFQTRLAESESLYRILCDCAADGILTFDLQGRVTYANQAAEKLFKVPFGVSKGTHFKNYIDKKSFPKAMACFALAKQGKSPIHEEVSGVDRDGQVIPIELNVTPLYRDGKVFSIHVISRDIRRRRELEALRIESEKMEGLNHFISGTTLEIKYPLKAILDRLTELLSLYEKRDFEYIGFKEYKHIMQTISAVCQQARYSFNIINRLINVNKRRLRFAAKQCDVNKIIRNSVGLIDEQFMRRNTKIKLKLGAKLPQAAINEIDLSEVIVNIITNAVQAMPAGGLVMIRTWYLSPKGRVCLSVQDQGTGIKKENLSKIFEPFFTTKQRGLEKSSGLGLTVVYAIVHACHGDVHVESSLRRGTLVTVELPPINNKH